MSYSRVTRRVFRRAGAKWIIGELRSSARSIDRLGITHPYLESVNPMPWYHRSFVAAASLVLASAVGAQSGSLDPRPVHPGAGTGPHYWIDRNLGNDVNPGTSSLPWRTVDRIESATLAPGTIVHVRAGVYDLAGNLTLSGKSGTASQWIGIEAEGAVTLRNAAPQNVIDVVNCRYLYLQGFEITHDNGGAAYGAWAPVDGVKFQSQDSDHVSLEFCRIHDVGNVGISSQAPLVQYLTVYACEIWNCYVGIYWGYYEDTFKRFAHYGRIARNWIHHCPPVDLDGTGYGIQIKGGSRGNVIEDNVLNDVAGAVEAAIAVYHISTNTGTQTDRNVIRRNLVHRSRSESIFAVEGALIENNLVVDTGTYGINVVRRNTGWGTFYGNLTIRNNSVCRVAASSGTAISLSSAAFTAPFVFANNLSIVTGGSQHALQGPGSFAGTASRNCCSGPVYGSGLGVVALGSLAAVQGTTFGQAGFLYPAAGSPLAGAATASLAAADDFNGNVRTGAFDVGAYEAVAASNPGWTPVDGAHVFGASTFTVTANQPVFAPGQSVSLSATLVNKGQPCLGNLHVGFLLPDGDTMMFFTDSTFTNFAIGSLAHPATWWPMVANAALTANWTVSLPSFFGFVWPPGLPAGPYVVRSFLAAPGTLADDSVDPGDLVSLTTTPMTFTG